MHEKEPVLPPTELGQQMPEEQPVSPAETLQRQSFDKLALQVLEIHDKRERIDEAAKDIIGTFDIRPEFFEDEGRAMTFAAIADRWSDLSGESPEESEEERHFLHDAVALLAREYSPVLEGAKQSIDGESSPLSERGVLAVYDRYTDRALSDAVTEKIQQGQFLASVKEKMGITGDNEDAYEVRVLSISSTETESYGLEAPSAPDWDGLPGDRTEKMAAFDEAIKLQDAVTDQRGGLVARGEKMAKELGRDQLFAPAWVTRLDGKTMLCISMPLAEKITSPELTEASRSYGDDDFQRDMAILEHEYVHTQGGVNVDHDVQVGINLEELRAEHFSGNKQGYQDIKGFFLDYATITGEHPADMFSGLEKGGSVAEVFASIARRVGLRNMLEVVMASPRNYVDDQSNEFSRNVDKYLGGFDGVAARLIDSETAAGRGQDVEDRITKRAQMLAERIKPGNEWLWTFKKRQGLNVVTDLVARRAEELGLKPREEAA